MYTVLNVNSDALTGTGEHCTSVRLNSALYFPLKAVEQWVLTRSDGYANVLRVFTVAITHVHAYTSVHHNGNQWASRDVEDVTCGSYMELLAQRHSGKATETRRGVKDPIGAARCESSTRLTGNQIKWKKIYIKLQGSLDPLQKRIPPWWYLASVKW